MSERVVHVGLVRLHDGVEPERMLRTVQAYLPARYEARLAYAGGFVGGDLGICVLVMGEDDAGWTWDGYVVPRLASGNMYVLEVS